MFSKSQLISKCLFEKIVWTKIPTKNLIDSVGILVQMIFSKRHFEINWPLGIRTTALFPPLSENFALVNEHNFHLG